MVGTAQSSPIVSGAADWKALRNRVIRGLVQLGVGMRNQGQGQGIDPGIALDVAGGELGQLGIVAAGQVELDLAEHVLDDVEVVGEPLRVDPPAFGAVDLGDDPAVSLDQDLAVLREAAEQQVARLQVRRRRPPAEASRCASAFEPVQAVEFGPDRGLRPFGSMNGEAVGSEASDVGSTVTARGRAHPADESPWRCPGPRASGLRARSANRRRINARRSLVASELPDDPKSTRKTRRPRRGVELDRPDPRSSPRGAGRSGPSPG